MNVRDVTYKCRDIGYGIEEGDVTGIWGDTDSWGKRELVPVNGDPVLFLFADEVVSDDEASGYPGGENPYAVVFASGTLQRTMDARDQDVPRVDKATCGTCGRSWNDAIITGSTPAPSARCPFERWHEYDEDENDDGYSWSDSSALWQIEHGTRGEPRTDSARVLIGAFRRDAA